MYLCFIGYATSLATYVGLKIFWQLITSIPPGIYLPVRRLLGSNNETCWIIVYTLIRSRTTTDKQGNTNPKQSRIICMYNKHKVKLFMNKHYDDILSSLFDNCIMVEMVSFWETYVPGVGMAVLLCWMVWYCLVSVCFRLCGPVVSMSWCGYGCLWRCTLVSGAPSPCGVQIMAWGLTGDKPLSAIMMAWVLSPGCIARPRWL